MSQPFVVQLQNRPGELAHLARGLAARGINIKHIAGGGAGRLGCAYLTTDDEAATREVLHGLGFSYVEGQMIVVEVEDRPGALADVSETLGAAGVDIHGVLIVGRRAGMVEIALSVDEPDRAREVLGVSTVYGSPASW